MISIISKVDTVSSDLLKSNMKAVGHNQKTIVFSTDHKRREQCLSELFAVLKEVGGRMLVAGKKLTGKHSLITMMAKAAKCYQESPYEIQVFKID